MSPASPVRWKRSHVHLGPARLVRLIGNPSAVGREDGIRIGEGTLQKRCRRPGFQLAALYAQIDDIDLRLPINLRERERAVLRQRGRKLKGLRRHQRARITITVGALPEQASAHRTKHDELSVEAPDGTQKRAAAARHAQGGAAVDVEQPDVLGGAIAHRERDAAPIGRESRRPDERPWRDGQRLLLAAGAEPLQRRQRRSGVITASTVDQRAAARDAELGALGQGVEGGIAKNGNGSPDRLETLEIERDGKHPGAIRVQQVTALEVPRRCRASYDRLAAPIVE